MQSSKFVTPFDKPVYVTRPLMPDLSSYVSRLADIWGSGQMTNGGAQHNTLEAALSLYLEGANLSLFNNGTTALQVAVRALEMQGEVILSPFTFAATAHVLSWAGLDPVFVDIDYNSMVICPNRIERAITKRTTAILGIHAYGNACDVKAIADISSRHGLKVLYDAAHAFGTKVDRKPVCRYGDATVYSFHATKLFHTAEGGAISTPSPELQRKVNLMRNFGISGEESVIMPGINGKMSELQAALGLCTLEILSAERAARLDVTEIYRERLSRLPNINTPLPKALDCDSLQYYPIRVKSNGEKTRDFVRDELVKFNVFARKYFYPLCSEYDCYRWLPSSKRGNLENAYAASKEVLCLPLFGGLGVEGANRVCDMLCRIMTL